MSTLFVRLYVQHVYYNMPLDDKFHNYKRWKRKPLRCVGYDVSRLLVDSTHTLDLVLWVFILVKSKKLEFFNQ
jgi:hypothetical protein